MTRIPNFPERYLREHATWHTNMIRDSHTGHGLEFLEFHRNFIRRSLNWHNFQGLNPRRVQPWTSIPSEIKRHPNWSRSLQDAENRIINHPESFSSSEELGKFIEESSLHRAIHYIGAEVFQDNDFASINYAPRSTLFYNWHGLIDKWWRQYEEKKKL